MKKSLRGRPKPNIDLEDILKTVRRYGQVMAAARELGCSDAYIHVKLKKAGLSLRQIRETKDLKSLMKGSAE